MVLALFCRVCFAVAVSIVFGITIARLTSSKIMTTMTTSRYYNQVFQLFLCCSLSTTSLAFVSRHRPSNHRSVTTGTGTPLHAWFPNEGMEAARASIGWWLMGAAGSGGAARSAFPQIFDD